MDARIKNIIESTLAVDFNRILSPAVGDIVYQQTEDGKFVKVRILGGQFYGSYGVSNFWDYENVETGEIEHDYGSFYRAE